RRAVELLEALTAEDEDALVRGGVSPARVQLLLASIYDDDAELADLAASHYEDALSRLPRDAYACNNLGVIALRGGDGEEALRWLTRALESDPRHETSYLNIARLLYVTGTPRHMVAVLEAIDHAGLDARCLANLSFALIEVAREDAHQGLATKGHQLKNLLGVIGSRLRSLARKQSDESQSAALGRLADKVTALYDEWAVYLRTMREEPTRHDSFSVNELVSDAARLAGGRVALRLGERLPELYGMREQLTEALVNLIRNGQEAQRDLGSAAPPLRVTTMVNASETAVQIIVEDRGPGIPPADLRRIFAPGYTTKRDGSGLGLAIAERVVRSHDGQLQIDSAPGSGTRVRISLPVGLESEVQHKRRRLPLLSVVRSAAAVEYVVEDEELSR
ncbi:MAG: tetratricopeptide repeat protein, partial [Myxococcales bacterium]|nr:tetratricopeptide repeat protein [Myxococcales bacterium]